MNKRSFFLKSITKLQSSAGELKMELNIGLEETVGELTGVKQDSSESECMSTTWESKETAPGAMLKKILTLLNLKKKFQNWKSCKFD